MNYPKPLKILVVGGDKTFKSTLLKLLTSQSIQSQYIHTVGINIYHSSNANRSIIYWDIPFAEFKLGRNISLIKEDADGVIIMTNKGIESSFDVARDWMKLFANDLIPVLLVREHKADEELIEKYREIIKFHQNKSLVFTKPMNCLRKKGVFEAINKFIEIIQKYAPLSPILSNDYDYSTPSTPQSRFTPSPFSSASFSPSICGSPLIDSKISADFLLQSKKNVSAFFEEIKKYIENIQAKSVENTSFETYTKNELQRLYQRTEIENETLHLEFDKILKQIEIGNEIPGLSCSGIEKMIDVRENCWRKNFEFLGYNLPKKR
ncbi:GTP-binding protein [Entamoeba marina]